MRRRSLTELASNPDLISGIYNYCDRWCERCPLTSRCLVFATEQVDHNGSLESHDTHNETFWQKLDGVLLETEKLIGDWARDAGIGTEIVVASKVLYRYRSGERDDTKWVLPSVKVIAKERCSASIVNVPDFANVTRGSSGWLMSARRMPFQLNPSRGLF